MDIFKFFRKKDVIITIEKQQNDQKETVVKELSEDQLRWKEECESPFNMNDVSINNVIKNQEKRNRERTVRSS